MNISIILAHPNPVSFNHAIANTAANTLRRNGHQVILRDLCQEQFPPLLSTAELRKDAELEPVVARHCQEIVKADGIIIVHPNWWGMPPAILKGWIDRVLRPEVAYRFVAGDKGEGVRVK
jgi:putative NADPH-quinone reductase